jgi:hypothetical protein
VSAWLADLGYELRYIAWACCSQRTLRPVFAKLLYHVSRLGKGGGVGVVSGPMQRLAFRLWSGILIDPKPLRGAALIGLLSLDPEAEHGHAGAET